jgi:hypothetical protein
MTKTKAKEAVKDAYCRAVKSRKERNCSEDAGGYSTKAQGPMAFSLSVPPRRPAVTVCLPRSLYTAPGRRFESQYWTSAGSLFSFQAIVLVS